MNKMLLTIFIVMFVIVSRTGAFQLVSSQEHQDVDAGKSFQMMCKSDSHYEYCVFKHNGNACNYEWKRSSDKVELQECVAYKHRINFTGVYDDHTCGMQLNNVTLEDAGEWSCEMEDYDWGHLSSGARHSQSTNLTVKRPTQKEIDSPIFLIHQKIPNFSNLTESTTSGQYVNGDKKEILNGTTIIPILPTNKLNNTNHNLNQNELYHLEASIEEECNNSLGVESKNCTLTSKAGKALSSSIDTTTPLVIVLVFIILAAIVVTIYVLHQKGKLPQSLYGLGGLIKDGGNNKSLDLGLANDAEKDLSSRNSIKKHPSIVKKVGGSRIMLSLKQSISRTDQTVAAPANLKDGENENLENGEKESMISKERNVEDVNVLQLHLDNNINPMACNLPSPSEFMKLNEC